MQKTTKQILGIVGLVAVAVTTAIAIQLPSPANAATSSEVELTVRVIRPGESYVNITKPTNDASYSNANIEVSTDYNYASEIEYTLSYTDPSGNTTEAVLPIYYPEGGVDTPSGTHSFTINLKDYGSYGRYVLNAKINGFNVYESSVAFQFSPFLPPSGEGEGSESGTFPDPSDVEPGNPTITIDPESGVDNVHVVVIDPATGKPIIIIDPVTGQPIPYIPGTVGPDGKIEIDFESYGIPEGNYILEITAFDRFGNIIASGIRYNIYYIPAEAPATPDTGSFLVQLNLSRTDYLISGLIIFGAAAGFGLFMLNRSKKSGRR